MKQRFDLLAFSLLVFSVVALACLVSDPKGFTLKDWQPLIASVVALSAAALAYNAAMAKVDYDKVTRDRDERRKRLGIYLRAEHVCNQLSDRAQSLSEKTRERYFGTRTVYLDELKLVTEAPDLIETWANLEVFPPKAAFKLSQVQSCIRTLSNFVATQAPETTWEIGQGIPYSGQMKVTHDLAKDLRRACEDVLTEIQPIVLTISRIEHG